MMENVVNGPLNQEQEYKNQTESRNNLFIST